MSKKVSANTIKNLTINKDEIIVFKKDDLELEINVKQYLPIQEKKELIELMNINSFDNKKYDNLLKDISYDILLTKYYTNINLPQDNSIAYNALKSCGLIDVIKSAIPECELEFINKNINSRIEEEKIKIEKDNQLSTVIKEFLDNLTNMLSNLSDKIPDLESTQKIIEDFKTLDIGKLEQLNKLKEFVDNKG